MKAIWLKLAFLLMLCAVIAFEIWHFRSSPSSIQQHSSPSTGNNKPDFVLLPTKEVTGLAHFFAGPKARIEEWEPTVGDMNDVEANLSQITALTNRYPEAFRHVEDPTQYFRQYGAVVINGRKSILVNAFCQFSQHEPTMWRKHLVIVSDGGKCYWRGLFDVSTLKFTGVSVNGVA